MHTGPRPEAPPTTEADVLHPYFLDPYDRNNPPLNQGGCPGATTLTNHYHAQKLEKSLFRDGPAPQMAANNPGGRGQRQNQRLGRDEKPWMIHAVSLWCQM